MTDSERPKERVDPDLFRAAKAHFLEAIDLSPAERSIYLERKITDPTLRSEVAALLGETEAAPTFDIFPRGHTPNESAKCDDDGSVSTGDSIGGYRILEFLGRGGMGAVYIAEQSAPRRKVALKIISSARSSPRDAERFRSEAEILGRLEHDGIASIYDAGTSDVGTAFIAMEFVDGIPLHEWTKRRPRDNSAIARIVLKIARAVAHAHQRGIIHRDLKPANVLVKYDDEPKVLDFGISRRIGADDMRQHPTETGQIVGTLVYMSPEQAAGRSNDVDTRSDVYALGVIAYELLSGRLPADIPRASFTETIAAIMETRPTHLTDIQREIDPDLAVIVHHALEKEKERRYSSASELADDLRRFLDHEPIVARPPSRAYRLRKFVRRHRVMVGGVVATFLALVYGIVATKIEERKADAARVDAQFARGESDRLRKVAENDRDVARSAQAAAEASLKESRSVQRFMDIVFRSASGESGGKDMRVVDALSHAERFIAVDFASEPRIESSVRLMLGRTRLSLGEFQRARSDLDRALELRRRIYGTDAPEVLDVRMTIGELLTQIGAFEEADRELSAVLEAQRSSRVPPSFETLARGISSLAHVRQMRGRFAEARALYDEAVAVCETRPANHEVTENERKREIAIVLTSTGMAVVASQTPDSKSEARKIFRRSLSIFEEIDAKESLDAATVMMNLAQNADVVDAVEDEEEIEDALRMMEKAIAIAERQLGRNSAKDIQFRTIHAWTLVGWGRADTALAVAKELRDDVKSLGEAGRIEAAEIGLLFGLIHMAKNELEASIESFESATRDYDESVGPTAAMALRCRIYLANVLTTLNRHRDAYDVIKCAYENAAKTLAKTDLLRGEVALAYGFSCVHLHEIKEAALFLEEAVAAISAACGDADPRVRAGLGQLAEVYKFLGRVADKKAIEERMAKSGK